MTVIFILLGVLVAVAAGAAALFTAGEVAAIAVFAVVLGIAIFGAWVIHEITIGAIKVPIVVRSALEDLIGQVADLDAVMKEHRSPCSRSRSRTTA